MTSASVTIRLAFFAAAGRRSSAAQETAISRQVEVGEHRGSSLESAVTERTADFDLPAYVPFNAGTRLQAVELVI